MSKHVTYTKEVTGVFAFDCRIEDNEFKKNKKCTIEQITNYYNFEYRRQGPLVHRSWNIGSRLLIPWSQLNYDQPIFNLISSKIKGFVHEWVETKERHSNEIMDVDDCDAQEDASLQNCNKQKNIYECDVEQDSAAEFVKFGNYINHILIGKHQCTVEKFSLKDTAMKMYHSKLEDVENRRLISIDMKLADAIIDETNSLPQGWALPVRKLHIEFSDKQRDISKRNLMKAFPARNIENQKM